MTAAAAAPSVTSSRAVPAKRWAEAGREVVQRGAEVLRVAPVDVGSPEAPVALRVADAATEDEPAAAAEAEATATAGADTAAVVTVDRVADAAARADRVVVVRLVAAAMVAGVMAAMATVAVQAAAPAAALEAVVSSRPRAQEAAVVVEQVEVEWGRA